MQDSIRLYKAEDLKTVRYLVGSSLMTPLATANMKACTHPLVIATWLAVSSVMIQLLNWWPTTNGGAGWMAWMGLLSPLPALAAVAVPAMLLVDWVQRPIFEEATREGLVARDMQQPHVYYSRSPASGFYILEHKNKVIGLVALDAADLSDVQVAGSRSTKGKTQKSAETAVIRHLHVEEFYHSSGIQLDLVKHAVSRAFSSVSPHPRRVIAVGSVLEGYKVDALRAAGFHVASEVGAFGKLEWKLGIFGWKNQWFEITREEWDAKNQ